MRKIALIIVACCFCLAAHAQLNRDALNSYLEDVRTYEQAVNDIVKDGRYQNGISAMTDLINRREKEADYPPVELASYYRLRGQGWMHLKQYQRVVDDGKQGLALLKKAGEEGLQDFPTQWYQLTLAYYYLGQKKEAMEAASECIKTSENYYGHLHSETLSAYSLRSNIAGFYNDRKQALHDRQKCFEVVNNNVKRNFTYLTASERTAYWEKYHSETTVMFAFAHKLREWQSTFTDDLYNQSLLAKGLLLTAEASLQRAIENDANLSAAYRQIRQLRKQAAERKNDDATIEADRLERSLGASASELYQFMDFLNVSVADVRAKLKPADIAVEFVDYRIGKDSTMYAALIMSPRWQHARFLPLIEAREIPQYTTNLTEKLWKPILDLVGGGVKDIYFSPTGVLYQLPIESHLLSDGRSMGEAYRMHRLSSTRWLALGLEGDQGEDAVVYGGLAYDSSIADMQQNAMRYPQVHGAKVGIPKTRGSLSGLDELPATKTEAEAIVATINAAAKKNLHADLLMGKNGTETSFKSLDGQHKQIVHIATHGFYDDKGTADALSRCGLYSAGADNALQGERIPADTDDGILTAQEISSLDLRGLNLVALSACQTGEGEITGDGVFGLQRGFKKAGARSLLMSLWPVDDAATCQLMITFYKHWISGGMTMCEALETAKRTVRSHKEKGWDDPKYWAAFILLDAY